MEHYNECIPERTSIGTRLGLGLVVECVGRSKIVLLRWRKIQGEGEREGEEEVLIHVATLDAGPVFDPSLGPVLD